MANEYDVVQVCKIAIYGLRRFWQFHWKAIIISVTIGVVAGLIVAKIVQGKKKRGTPWGWIISGISVAGLIAYGLTRKEKNNNQLPINNNQ